MINQDPKEDIEALENVSCPQPKERLDNGPPRKRIHGSVKYSIISATRRKETHPDFDRNRQTRFYLSRGQQSGF